MDPLPISYAAQVPVPPRRVGLLSCLAVAVSVLACPFVLGRILERWPMLVGGSDGLRTFGTFILVSAAVISFGVTLFAAGRSDRRPERTWGDSILIAISFVLSFCWVFIFLYIWLFIYRR